MSTLYELTGQFNQVAEMLSEEEFNPAVIDTLEAIDMAIEDKADNYARLIKNQESDSKGIAEEIKRLQARKQSIDNSVKNMKLSLQNAMNEIGKTKFKTNLFSFNIQKNPISVNIVDENLIPDEFKKIKIEFDKTAIKKFDNVPGVELTQSESLRIR
ncbi:MULTISPECIES: siphovirus Gp157 family protein [Lactobacillales]|uniref:siphovirus Gp157 family protein n=1 Tax=Lactobacillales TaxID=186826 RepID=UPI00026C8336|nr:siphovirus Gp157 family protein [Carnobacterium maltaromaticum]